MLNALVAGLTSGLLFGLLGFSIVVLFRMTGIPNFAQGSLATLGAAVVYKLTASGHANTPVAIIAAIAAVMALGLCIYALVMRPGEDAGDLNLTVRTLGLYLLLFAASDKFLGQGQPFAFPRLFPERRLHVVGASISVASIGILLTAAALTAAFAAFFQLTRLGLLLRGLSADRGTARLLGVNVSLLDALSWMAASGLAAIVGILTAPSALVSSDMMENSLLFVFTGVIIGGLTSLVGAFVGGLSVGVVQGIVFHLANSDLALFAVFGLFLLTLVIRPNGLFGEPTLERL